jgi:hypothetical protein
MVKKVKSRIYFSIALMIFAIITFCLGLSQMGKTLTDFMSGFYAGTGGALFGVSAGVIIYHMILLKNEQRMAQAEVNENDERNRFISGKTGYLTCFIMLPLLYAATIVSGLINLTVFFTLLSVTAIMICILIITYFILSKIY